MKKLILPVILLVGWVFFLSSDIPVGENFLPSAGRFFSPFEGVWRNVKPVENSFTISTPTKGEVRILFDERDVPHIYSQNLEDAIYAQGYLHAANRLFAMDLSTRAAAGRVSELVGARALAYDHQQREKGFEGLAIKKAESWEKFDQSKSIVNAYVSGVNDYIGSLSYTTWPVEYKILSHPPVTWTTKHIALMATNMAIMLCMAENDLPYTKAKAILSPEEFAFLYPDHNPLESPVIPSEKKWDFKPVEISSLFESKEMPIIKSQTEDDKQKDVNGSNSWAVSGKRTANGNPLLANDPHLNLTLPNIWYEMEIHTPQFSIHGASIPGLPFIIIGFTEHYAWGTTNSGQDVLDWYQITWRDGSRQEYLLDGKYEKAVMRVEEIEVRGGDKVIDTVRYTHWGPVISRGDHKDMAMKWIPHERSATNDLEYLYTLHHGKSLDDYRHAMKAYQYPAQNKIFASVNGDIAMSVAGIMPLRTNNTGTTILPGDKRANDWKGFIPFEHSPFIINPVKGYVSSANQAPVDTTYPYQVVGTRVFEDYRNRVINAVLDTLENVTVEDMKSLQQNNYNLHAAELLPVLLKILQENKCTTAEENIYVINLKGWNYEQHRDSVSPVLYEIWYDEFERLMFDELDSLELMHPEDWRIIEMVKADVENKFFDVISTAEKKETLADIICQSFSAMVKTYLALDGEERKNWGTYKAAEIPHLARLAPFGVMGVHTSGAKHVVNAMGKTHGPSWRMIVELSKPIKAYVNYPGGQSGNPASPHYHDMLDQFFEGKYYEVSLRKDPETWTPSREIIMSPR